MPAATRLLFAILSTATLLGCSEKPQTFSRSQRFAESYDQTARVDGQRQRTLLQGESGRVSNDNVLH